MPDALNRLQQLFGSDPVLCDGAMGTVLYDRGVFINRCYDEINLSQPELVASIHEEYLQAGAQLIETNTYGANRFRLERFGLGAKVEQINQAGVRLARQAVARFAEKKAAKAWVAGSLGPLGVQVGAAGDISLDEARDAFAEQIHALVSSPQEPGIDILILETMHSLAEAEQALLAAREIARDTPVVVLVTVGLSVSGDGDESEILCLDGTRPELAGSKLAAWGADGIGVNCSTGPAVVLSAVESMAAGAHLPLFAMPNAGMPRSVDGRNIYLSSPEYLASFSRKFLRAGVQFVGGCCGTTPAHTRAMRAFLRAEAVQIKAQTGAVSRPTVQVIPEDAVPPAPLAQRSSIGRLIAEGRFVTLVEVVPPRGIDTSRELAGARLLAASGVNGINIPDSPRASARMSAQSLCIQIQQQTGLETVLHYTCRDRNLLSIQSDLLGASSIGLKNILCLTGDPPKLGNYPDATAVFDVDAIGLIKIVRRLNHGIDIGGNSIGVSTGLTIAAAANPGVADIENEIRRFACKVEAGAEYAITQPVFDLGLLEAFLRRVEQFRIPIIAGIWPLTSLRNAEFMRNDLRVAVPDSIMLRMANAGAGATPSPEASRAEGILIAQEMLATARPMVQGIAASAPFGRYETAVESLTEVLEPGPRVRGKPALAGS